MVRISSTKRARAGAETTPVFRRLTATVASRPASGAESSATVAAVAAEATVGAETAGAPRIIVAPQPIIVPPFARGTPVAAGLSFADIANISSAGGRIEMVARDAGS